MNYIASHPVEVSGALYGQAKRQKLERSPEQLIKCDTSTSKQLGDVRTPAPSIPLLFSSGNLFDQSLAYTLGAAFEPTPFRANHKHESKRSNKDSATSIVGQESPCWQFKDNSRHNLLYLAVSVAQPSSVSVLSSCESCQSEDDSSKEERQEMENESMDQFSRHQQRHWEEQYRSLVEFRRETGHCRVPHKYKANIGLARWVKRQRYQYRLRQEGDLTSTMTDFRLKKLEEIGFVWFSHASTWEQRLMEVKAFRDETGHCNVPSAFPANPKLAVWVKCQRRQYKLFKLAKSSHMTPTRIEALEEIGFQWELRQTSTISRPKK
ncbi:MAG: hypothetical protein SGBAC_011107 [Bacillariaceae sp.]